jgi:hypothetical protein
MSAEEDRQKARARPDDVLAAVLDDHADIKELFGRVSAAPGGAAKADAFRDLVVKLVVHETAEQEVVHPLAKDDAASVVEERLAEEKSGEKLLSELEKIDVDGPDFEQQFTKLHEEVLAHAEAEENQEHPIIERKHDGERLQSLVSRFRAAEKAAPTHPHPHGPTSAVGNAAVGPVVALADRVRDAIRSDGGS